MAGKKGMKRLKGKGRGKTADQISGQIAELRRHGAHLPGGGIRQRARLLRLEGELAAFERPIEPLQLDGQPMFPGQRKEVLR